MSVLDLKAVASAGIAKADYSFNDHTSEKFTLSYHSGQKPPGIDTTRALLISWEKPTGPELYQEVVSYSLRYWVLREITLYGTIFVNNLYAPFDEKNVTWETMPKYSSSLHLRTITSPDDGKGGYEIYEDSKVGAFGVVSNGIILRHAWDTMGLVLDTSRGPCPPVLRVVFGKQVMMSVTSVSPSEGSRLSKAEANRFSFTTKANGKCLGEIKVASGNFKWRVKGTSAEHLIPITQGSDHVDVPAKTFSTNDYEYSFHFSTNSGQTLDTPWTAFTTKDTLPTAKPLQPNGGVVNANEPIEFTWSHHNDSGTAPTGADIYIAPADVKLYAPDITLPDKQFKVSGTDTRFVLPAGTLTSGKYTWKVRSYNMDSQPGDWSTPVELLAVGAPAAPQIVIVDGSPRPLFRWQSAEQVGYQVQIDNETPETHYGSLKSWRVGKYLDNGPHAFRVRVKNAWGFWSDWSTMSINIRNVPGVDISLSYTSGNSVDLKWTGTGFDFYVVYRNGIPIAKLKDQSYTDYYSAGEIEYTVRGCHSADGNYSLSNAVHVGCYPDSPIIKSINGTDWLDMPFSAEQHRTFKTQLSRHTQSVYLAGRKYPVTEKSPFYDRSLSFEFATDDNSVKAIVENLVGETICIKTPSGEALIGTLSAVPIVEELFYTVYAISVTQEYFEEEIDLDA